MQKQPTNTKAKCCSKLKGRTRVVSKHYPFQQSTYLCGCSGDRVRVVESIIIRKMITNALLTTTLLLFYSSTLLLFYSSSDLLQNLVPRVARTRPYALRIGETVSVPASSRTNRFGNFCASNTRIPFKIPKCDMS